MKGISSRSDYVINEAKERARPGKTYLGTNVSLKFPLVAHRMYSLGFCKTNKGHFSVYFFVYQCFQQKNIYALSFRKALIHH